MKTRERTTRCLLIGLVVFVAAPAGVKADYCFGPPQDLGLGSGGYVSVSADGLELYFMSTRSGGLGDEDLWVSTRQSTADPWGPPVNAQALNSSCREAFPSISPDGLTLYFSDFFYGPDRPGGTGGHDLWMSTRTALGGPWSTPVNMGAPFNSANQDVSLTISHDGLTFIFASDRPGGSGGYDLWMCTRPSLQDPWGPAVNMGPTVNSGSHDYYGNLSPDDRVLFFESNRSGNYAGWVTIRKSINDPWEPPTLLPAPLFATGVGCVASDGMSFYSAMSQVPILPVVDFNGNGRVDTDDLLPLITSWGQDNPAVDIGPAPWGDGTVDAADLEVLMSYWGQELDDPTLVGHWALDETEGIVAHDRVGANDGLIMGLPQWQPQGGTIAGALQLNGTTFVTATSALSPGAGPFSVLAWSKGGAPGQTLVAQAGGANWLTADARGAFATELCQGGRTAVGLSSEAVITDGGWHRLAFAWDGAHRRLYVDDVLVAEDMQESLADAYGKLILGAGRNMTPGSFFSGLIDDVRLYTRAVTPASK
jgi:hypothetical protein